MRFLASCALLAIVSTTWAQDAVLDPNPNQRLGTNLFVQQVPAGDTTPADNTAGKRKKDEVPNPFARPSRADMMSMMGGMGGGDMEMEMGYGDMGMEMDMGMGMGMSGMDAYSGASPEQVFREGLQRAIIALRKAKSGDTKETLRGHIREAFEKRYETMIAARKKDIARLKRSVANLEAEMHRREAAKDRVVQLQLQSVQLAAEGILEPNELLPSTNNAWPGAGDDAFGN